MATPPRVPSAMQNRGRSTAHCGSTPPATRSTVSCRCPCGCIYPPMLDRVAYSPFVSAWVRIPGMMVWYGRRRGASALGCAASRSKPYPRFWRVKPHPSGTRPVPKPMKLLLTKLTALPAPSTTWKDTVPDAGSASPWATARAGSNVARARAAMRCSSRSQSVFCSVCCCRSGSQTKERASPSPSRVISSMACIVGAEVGHSPASPRILPMRPASSSASSPRSAMSPAMPCPLGGTCHSRTSRYRAQIGSGKAVRCSRRSSSDRVPPCF
mmetsp:Transcript_16173/g.24642  ORF Transcript_16173/g.24642 Transcript_16173/m.24642 type:complete len:269 (+) Transcript_16173:144-950(+)